MKLISILGKGNYEETCYCLDPQGSTGCCSRYAPVAICRLLSIDSLVLLCTADARTTHLTPLTHALDPAVALTVVDIPSGRNEAELWEIFNLLAGQVSPGESIALDMTHGFRSLMLVAVLTAEFLRTARGVQVDRMLYGAYDARDESVTPSRTPLLDLTPMLKLLAWADAADRFTRYGEGHDLAMLLRSAKPPHQRQKASREVSQIAKKMGSASGQLLEMAQGMNLVRTFGVLEQAAKLQGTLSELDLSESAASPFRQVLEPVAALAGSLALAEPDESATACLERQRALIQWYADHGQYMQAATLGREWMVSWLLVLRGKTDLKDDAARKHAEDELNCISHLRKTRTNKVAMEGVPDEMDLPGWWQRIALDTRNDIDHAGMRRQETPARALSEGIEQFARKITSWPMPKP